MAQISDELRVIVTAEVDKAVKSLQEVDTQTKKTSDAFEVLGKSISAAFVIKSIQNFATQSVAAYNQQQQAVSVLNSTIKATGASSFY